MKNLSFEDLPKAIELSLEKLATLEEELNIIKQNFQPKVPDELMTRQETADYFKINSTTLWSWTNKGKLIRYGIGARRYYKRSEIENVLIKLK
jgi:Helix-turn-helix domain